MDNFSIYFSSLHHIDIIENRIIIPDKTPDEIDYRDYLHDLIQSILKEDIIRKYKEDSDSTEVISNVKDSIKNQSNQEKNVLRIAQRLLIKELNAQEKHKQITEIQKGSLIQSYFKYEGINYYVIVKIEHSAFIDETDLRKHIGLPFKKKILKICLFKLNNKNEIEDIIVSDSNASISQYWWQDFLELLKVKTDDYNTEISYDAISNLISRKVKDKSPRDHMLLHNNLIGYYNTQSHFNIDKLYETVFGDFVPLEPSIDIVKLKTEIIDIFQKKNIDTKFIIIKDKISARKIHKIFPVKHNIEISVKDYDPDIERDIIAVKDNDGQKYLKIKTDNDETYRIFSNQDKKQ